VLSPEDEAVIVAFRKRTLLPLDDCLYTLQPSIPYLTRYDKLAQDFLSAIYLASTIIWLN